MNTCIIVIIIIVIIVLCIIVIIVLWGVRVQNLNKSFNFYLFTVRVMQVVVLRAC